MKTLSSFEATLARIVTGLIGPAPVDDILPLLVREHARPPCLSRECVEWLQDALAKGCTQRLARAGWRDEAIHTSTGRKHGRLWQRNAPNSMPLHFSRNSMLLLLWMTAANAAQSKASGRVQTEAMTFGDHLLALLIFDRLEYAPLIQMNLAGKAAVKANPLIPLVFPDAAILDFDSGEIDFEPWFRTDRIWILEALQSWLCQRWTACERENRLTGSYGDLLRRGRTQAAVLTAFLAAADAANRRDLALFTLVAARTVLESTGQHDGPWLKQLNLQGLRMSQRAGLYRAALALFHVMPKLEQWQRDARAASFYDENYESSQFWLSRWEDLQGDEVAQRSAGIIRTENPAASIG